MSIVIPDFSPCRSSSSFSPPAATYSSIHQCTPSSGHPPTYPSILPSFHPLTFPSSHPFFHSHKHTPTHTHTPIHPPTHLSTHPSTHPSTHHPPTIHLSIHPSIHPSSHLPLIQPSLSTFFVNKTWPRPDLWRFPKARAFGVYRAGTGKEPHGLKALLEVCSTRGQGASEEGEANWSVAERSLRRARQLS